MADTTTTTYKSDISATNETSSYLPPASTMKRLTPNVSSGWVVMLLSGLIAAVVFLFATGQGGQKYSVAVIEHRIEPGKPITAADIREERVTVDKAQLDRLVRFGDTKQFEGWIATTTLEPGDLVLKSTLRQAAASSGQRSMSIPVDKSHAVGGDLAAGDRVDIIDASNTPAAYVAQNLEVLSVNNSGGSALGSTTDFSVTVAVNAEQAARLSQTIKGNRFDIVESTGATPLVPIGGQ